MGWNRVSEMERIQSNSWCWEKRWKREAWSKFNLKRVWNTFFTLLFYFPSFQLFVESFPFRLFSIQSQIQIHLFSTLRFRKVIFQFNFNPEPNGRILSKIISSSSLLLFVLLSLSLFLFLCLTLFLPFSISFIFMWSNISVSLPSFFVIELVFSCSSCSSSYIFLPFSYFSFFAWRKLCVHFYDGNQEDETWWEGRRWITFLWKENILNPSYWVWILNSVFSFTPFNTQLFLGQISISWFCVHLSMPSPESIIS